MELWAELFSDWVGISSFLVIAGVLVIAGYFIWYIMSATGSDQSTD